MTPGPRNERTKGMTSETARARAGPCQGRFGITRIKNEDKIVKGDQKNCMARRAKTAVIVTKGNRSRKRKMEEW